MNVMSMTGYGSCTLSSATWSMRCEVKSLNSKGIEAYFRLPKGYSSWEVELLKLLKSQMQRGKFECTFECQTLPQVSPPALEGDHPAIVTIIDRLIQLQKAIEEHGQGQLKCAPVNLLEMMASEELKGFAISVNKTEESQAEIGSLMRASFEGALLRLSEARLAEGRALAQAMNTLLDEISGQSEVIRKHVKSQHAVIFDHYQKRIEDLLNELSSKVPGLKALRPDSERLLSECALMVDRIDVEEELTRLRGHVEHFQAVLSTPGAIGRKLDFICQELNREINTVASKTNMLDISKVCIEAKQSIEQLRQQVQNIE